MSEMPEKGTIGLVLVAVIAVRQIRKRFSLGAKVARAKARVKA